MKTKSEIAEEIIIGLSLIAFVALCVYGLPGGVI